LDPYGSDSYNALVSLNKADGTWNVESLLKLPEGTQPQISPGELLECEEIVKNDPRVQELAKEVGGPVLLVPALGMLTNFRDMQVLNRTRSSLTDGPLDTMTVSPYHSAYSRRSFLRVSRNMRTYTRIL
jgi:hypothetical protein